MSPSGPEPRTRGSSAKPSLQDRVSQFYYSHGLFCSTYPISVISAAICVALLCCFPLIHLPLPGNAPLQIWTSATNASTVKEPFAYIQQVVLRIAVLPWEPELKLGDAFRAPIYEVFKLLEVVRNYEHQHSSKSLGHVCLHVEATKRPKYQKVLPQYSCLVLSPANLWQQDVQQFIQDNSILTTIFNHHSIQKGKSSITEMLFGMHLFDSGIKRYPFRNRPRVIQYAITLFFKEYDKNFVEGLREKLQSIYTLHQDDNQTAVEDVNTANNTLLIQYPGEINYLEFIPITISFIALFLYYYFSVRKIELIKSKFGMAFSAAVAVLGSLSMTLGLCFFFGLTLTLQGKEIFPYLVILVGLENVLVLTKSVLSIPQHLDVKIRLAQGLSREGWSITKNLLLEITILTFGLLTFVPVIQEFCIFAIVGLITDFFLQMFFFSPIVGIDIRRMENQVEKTHPSLRTHLYQTHGFYEKNLYNNRGMNRSKSHPRLNSFPTNVVAGQAQGAQEKKIPKRVRLVTIWARTRFFQRSFMILMVIWIIIIGYNNGYIEQYIINPIVFKGSKQAETSTEKEQNFSMSVLPILNSNNTLLNVNYVTHNPFEIQYEQNKATDLDKLKHSEYSPWLKLSLQHWPAILKKYNLSLSGQFVAILPNIKLSHVVRPEEAVLMRNPLEKYGDKFQWQTLAAALDPLEFQNSDSVLKKPLPQSEQPFYPTSPMEIMFATILCTISIIVLAYTFVVLYRCVCTRNYAEWRASWFSERSEESGDDQVLLEAVPLVLEGHQQQIECLATDGINVVSACLGSHLKIWDNLTGEHLRTIDRKRRFCSDPQLSVSNNIDDSESDLETRTRMSPDSPTTSTSHWRIDTNFSKIKADESNIDQNLNTSPYDFSRIYSELNESGTLRKRTTSFVRMLESLDSSGDDCERDITSVKTNKLRNSFSGSSKSNSFDSDSNTVNSSLSLNRELSDSGASFSSNKLSTLWCIEYSDNLIAVGCADGRIEFWEGATGHLKCVFEDGTDAGITHIKIIGSRVIAARLHGTLEFLQLQTYTQGRPIDWNFTCAYRRTHVRTGSYGSMTDHSNLLLGNDASDDDLKCSRVLAVKAHQQPITCMDCEGGRVVTGSQDHTLKVFRIEDGNALYTLHGHCGPITCIFIDRICPATSGSGSQDGMLCVWDLITGTCMYNIQAHNGTIVSLTYSASYVISLGTDDRLCVWERFQGHLLNSIQLAHSFTSQVLMLAPHLVITARNGGLAIWDVRSGECVRTISFGTSAFIFIKQVILLRDAVLCDYGNKLAMVRFPLITHKTD